MLSSSNWTSYNWLKEIATSTVLGLYKLMAEQISFVSPLMNFVTKKVIKCRVGNPEDVGEMEDFGQQRQMFKILLHIKLIKFQKLILNLQALFSIMNTWNLTWEFSMGRTGSLSNTFFYLFLLHNNYLCVLRLLL